MTASSAALTEALYEDGNQKKTDQQAQRRGFCLRSLATFRNQLIRSNKNHCAGSERQGKENERPDQPDKPHAQRGCHRLARSGENPAARKGTATARPSGMFCNAIAAAPT